MCCECNNIIKAITISLIIILIVILAIVVINNQNNPNILVAIAKPADNTTLRNNYN